MRLSIRSLPSWAPHQVVAFVETVRPLHVHWPALKPGRVHESNPTVTKANGQTFQQSQNQQDSRDLQTGFWTAESCVQMLRTVEPQTELALAWVHYSRDTCVWTRLFQSPLFAELPDTRENDSSGPARDAYLLLLFSVGRSSKRVLLHRGPLSHCRFGTLSLRVVPRGRTGALLQASSQPFLTGDYCQVAVQLTKGVAADRFTGLPRWDPLPSAWVCHPCAHHPTCLVNCRSSFLEKNSETRFC